MERRAAVILDNADGKDNTVKAKMKDTAGKELSSVRTVGVLR